jgi:hypothetical protein
MHAKAAKEAAEHLLQHFEVRFQPSYNLIGEPLQNKVIEEFLPLVEHSYIILHISQQNVKGK